MKILQSPRRKFLDEINVNKFISELRRNNDKNLFSLLMSVVKDFGDSSKPIKCFEYAFGDKWKEKGARIFFDESGEFKTPEGYFEIEEPTLQDIVLYLKKKFIGEECYLLPEHAGIYTANGRIRSKWGTGPVFSHDIACTPSSYGDEVRFYRKTS